jgi:hypothetical protein
VVAIETRKTSPKMARPKKQTKRQRETEANKAKAVLLDNMTLMFMNSVQKQSPVRNTVLFFIL